MADALVAVAERPQVDVIAMSDGPGYDYPSIVRREIPQQDIAAYRLAAEFLNDGSYDVLSVQHEFGIFGGDSGRFLLTLLRETRMPIVTTLHTVLRDPLPSQRAILDEVLELSTRVIVMSGRAVAILDREHGLGCDKIDMVPHGIPDFSPVSGRLLRDLLGIAGPMLLTFGLLSPGKGIEHVIRAMPAIVEKIPNASYIVLGATHPHVLTATGEAYRESLEWLSDSLGVSANVRFVNQFVTTEELTAYLGAADIYVSPYSARDQITSGTLAYAVGAGKCVIATPYPYAEELLASGRGLLVPFSDPSAIAEAVIRIQERPEDSREMARRAAVHGATMQWPEVGRRTMESLARAAGQRPSRYSASVPSKPVRSMIPPFNPEHLLALSDDTGILQHAKYTVPNRSEGYCVDDNARALILTTQLAEDLPLTQDLARAQARYLAFVCHSFNPLNGRFRNFMDLSRRWLEDAGSEDSHGRALWALGTVVGRSAVGGFRMAAYQVFEQACGAIAQTTSPRTWAYAVLAAEEVLRTQPTHKGALELRESSADRLLRQYVACSTDGWRWFEATLTYANARLSQALIVAGRALGAESMTSAGIDSLVWLAQRQTTESGVFAPVGTHLYFTDQGDSLTSGPSMFDQQPLETWASVSAYLTAADATSDPTWFKEADRAYGWFLGDNMLGLPLYDAVSGGCRDGLHQDRPNENQGAESTLSFLCSTVEMRHASGVAVGPIATAL